MAGIHRGPRSPRPDWSPDDAESLASRAGIAQLGDRHWKVIATCREETARRGRMPRLARIEALTGIDDAEVHRLFPGDAVALIARLSGVAPAANTRRPARDRMHEEE